MQAGTVMEAPGKCQLWEKHSWTLEVTVRVLGPEEKKALHLFSVHLVGEGAGHGCHLCSLI